MKRFYTPAIDGEYRFDLQKRLEDMEDNKAYDFILHHCGLDAVDTLDYIGSVKVSDVAPDGTVKGYWTYQQQDL